MSLTQDRDLARARFDYFGALADYGIPYSVAHAQATSDKFYSPTNPEGVEVKPSNIAGDGLFATKDYLIGDDICLARIGEDRTEAGRYTNHSHRKNATFVFTATGDIALCAIEYIREGDEITVDYRDSLSLHIERPVYQAETTGLSVKDGKSEIVHNNTPRYAMSGFDAAAYDLMLNDDINSNMTLKDRILALESITEAIPQVETPVTHEFIDGLYKRQVTFKAGTLATGKIHPVDHMDVMLSGEMMIATAGGFEVLKAPLTLTSRAGRKKAGYALTDVVWATYHPTSATTVEEVEKEIFTDEFLDIEGTYNQESMA